MKDSYTIPCPHCLTSNLMDKNNLIVESTCKCCHKALFTGQPIQLNDRWLNNYLSKNSTPLLIAFWAPWCDRCKKMCIAFAAAAGSLEPDTRLGTINIEQNELVAARFDIRTVPTVILFDGFSELGRMSGLMSTQEVIQMVNALSPAHAWP